MVGGVHAGASIKHYKVGLFAAVVDKVEHYRYDQLIKTTYARCDTGHFNPVEGMDWAHRLNGFTGLRIDYSAGGRSYQEIPYTEDAARFFHDAMISLCRLGDRINEFFSDNARLALAISSQTPLLGDETLARTPRSEGIDHAAERG